VVLTGLAEDAAGAAAVQAGAQDYFVKGQVQGGQLARAIVYAIGRRQTEQAERELLLAEAQAREAQRLERGLTPKPFVRDASVWVASRSRVGRRRALLGGDFFDLVQTESGHVHALVGDVCGQGPDEAALGVSLRAAWRGLTLSGAPAESTLETLQSILEHERALPSLFATLCLITIDPVAETGELVMAGHPRPALIDGTSVRALSEGPGCAAIGIGLSDWTTERVTLPHDWALLLYTDGIIEGRTGPDPRRLGERGLHAALAKCLATDPDWRSHPSELMDTLLDLAEKGTGEPLSDDVVMLLVGATASPPCP
jgi:serine phosphatase RsbU (regulator of sigma subunit)